MDALESAIEAAGGVSKLADLLGIYQSTVSNWKSRGQVPAPRCISIEAITGISRYELRPDVFGVPPQHESKAA